MIPHLFRKAVQSWNSIKPLTKRFASSRMPVGLRTAVALAVSRTDRTRHGVTTMVWMSSTFYSANNPGNHVLVIK
jgi:hypothetical protein